MQSKEPLEQKIYQVVFVGITAITLCYFYRFLSHIFRFVGVPVVLLFSYLLANVVYKKLRKE